MASEVPADEEEWQAELRDEIIRADEELGRRDQGSSPERVAAFARRNSGDPVLGKGEDKTGVATGETTLPPDDMLEGTLSDPEEEIFRTTERELIEEMLADLEVKYPKEAQILRARYLDGKSIEQIASELGLSVGYVRQLRTKALRRARHPARLGPVRLWRKDYRKEAEPLR